MEAVSPRKTDNNPAMAVLEAIADHAGREPTDLETPLYTALDPDALDRLLDSAATVAVTFRYDNYVVTIDNDGSVTVDSDDAGGGAT